MRRIIIHIAFFFQLLFLIPGISFAQPYLPFIEEGKVWTEASKPSMAPEFIWVTVNRMLGDTLIGGNLYKKVYDENDDYVCAVYEDTLTKRVYCDHSALGNYLLYDFTLQVGDTLFGPDSFPLIVNARDSVFFAGKNRLRLDMGLWPGSYVYEGIGSVYQGVFLPKNLIGAHTQLLCYFEHDSLVYHNDVISTNCFFLTSVNKIISDLNSADVYFSKQKIWINTISDEDYQFRLFSIEGREIMSFKGKGMNTLNADHLNQSLYIYSLYFNKTNVLRTGKLNPTN